jgi:hypothetical protein
MRSLRRRFEAKKDFNTEITEVRTQRAQRTERKNLKKYKSERV